MGCGNRAGCLPPERVLLVAQEWPYGCNPNKGYYAGVQVAINAALLLTPTETDPVVIYIAPGNYPESIVLHPFVYLKAWGSEGAQNLAHSVTIGTAGVGVTTLEYAPTGGDNDQLQLEGISFLANLFDVDTSGKSAGSSIIYVQGCAFAGLADVTGAASHELIVDDSTLSGGADVTDVALKLLNRTKIETSLVVNDGCYLEAMPDCQLPATTIGGASTAAAAGAFFNGNLTVTTTAYVFAKGARVSGVLANDGPGACVFDECTVWGSVENNSTGEIDITSAVINGDVTNSAGGRIIAHSATVANGDVENEAGGIILCNLIEIRAGVDAGGHLTNRGVGLIGHAGSVIDGNVVNIADGQLLGTGGYIGGAVTNSANGNVTIAERAIVGAVTNSGTGVLGAINAEIDGAVVNSGGGSLFITGARCGADVTNFTGTLEAVGTYIQGTLLNNAGTVNARQARVGGNLTNGNGAVAFNADGIRAGTFASESTSNAFVRGGTFTAAVNHSGSGELHAEQSYLEGGLVISGAGDVYVEEATIEGIIGTGTGTVYAENATCRGDVSLTGTPMYGNGINVQGSFDNYAAVTFIRNAYISGNLTNVAGPDVRVIRAEGAVVACDVSNLNVTANSYITIVKGSYGSLVGPGPIDRDQDGISLAAGPIAGDQAGPGGNVYTINLAVPFYSTYLRVLVDIEPIEEPEEDDHACDMINHHVLRILPAAPSFDVSILVQAGITLLLGANIHWNVTPLTSIGATVLAGVCPPAPV